MRNEIRIETGTATDARGAQWLRRWAGILAILLMATFSTACREETLGDKVDDATEDVKDAAEDVGDKAEDATDKAEDAADKAEDELDKQK
jgi:hypothetical protein